jgi:hypothetical protein
MGVLGKWQEVVVLSAVGRGREQPQVLPLRLLIERDESTSRFVEKTASKLNLAEEHGLYGVHITTNPLRMDGIGCQCPVLDVGYSFADDSNENLLPLRHDLKLVLKVKGNVTGADVSFNYRTDWFQCETVEALGACLLSTLELIANEPGLPASDILLAPQSVDTRSSSIELHAEEAFNF